MSHSGEAVRYESRVWFDAESVPGVRFEVAKVSLARRVEVTRRVRAFLSELECRSAGESLEDKLAAAELEAAVNRVYIEWGLTALEGLEIDGERATVESLVERGPERLCAEIAAAVRGQCTLSGEERKN